MYRRAEVGVGDEVVLDVPEKGPITVKESDIDRRKGGQRDAAGHQQALSKRDLRNLAEYSVGVEVTPPGRPSGDVDVTAVVHAPQAVGTTIVPPGNAGRSAPNLRGDGAGAFYAMQESALPAATTARPKPRYTSTRIRPTLGNTSTRNGSSLMKRLTLACARDAAVLCRNLAFADDPNPPRSRPSPRSPRHRSLPADPDAVGRLVRQAPQAGDALLEGGVRPADAAGVLHPRRRLDRRRPAADRLAAARDAEGGNLGRVDQLSFHRTRARTASSRR